MQDKFIELQDTRALDFKFDALIEAVVITTLFAKFIFKGIPILNFLNERLLLECHCIFDFVSYADIL